jgi:hypothetical protein
VSPGITGWRAIARTAQGATSRAGERARPSIAPPRVGRRPAVAAPCVTRYAFRTVPGAIGRPVADIASSMEGSMSQENLESEVARLRAENEALKARTQHRGGQLRVSDKGGVSVYGLGRFPVTLYKEQWRRLLDMADEIRAFIREHESELKSKD